MAINAVVCYLAKPNSAFRESTDILYENNNEKFLGLVQMLNKFDPVIVSTLNTSCQEQLFMVIRVIVVCMN